MPLLTRKTIRSTEKDATKLAGWTEFETCPGDQFIDERHFCSVDLSSLHL